VQRTDHALVVVKRNGGVHAVAPRKLQRSGNTQELGHAAAHNEVALPKQVDVPERLPCNGACLRTKLLYVRPNLCPSIAVLQPPLLLHPHPLELRKVLGLLQNVGVVGGQEYVGHVEALGQDEDGHHELAELAMRVPCLVHKRAVSVTHVQGDDGLVFRPAHRMLGLQDP